MLKTQPYDHRDYWLIDIIYIIPGAGLVLCWEQATGLLYSSGDVQRISLWDTHKEMKIQVVWVWLIVVCD